MPRGSTSEGGPYQGQLELELSAEGKPVHRSPRDPRGGGGGEPQRTGGGRLADADPLGGDGTQLDAQSERYLDGSGGHDPRPRDAEGPDPLVDARVRGVLEASLAAQPVVAGHGHAPKRLAQADGPADAGADRGQSTEAHADAEQCVAERFGFGWRVGKRDRHDGRRLGCRLWPWLWMRLWFRFRLR